MARPLALAFFKFEGRVRSSAFFNGLEDTCKHTYLNFFVSSLVILLLRFVSSNL